jgi:hypothetical protein
MKQMMTGLRFALALAGLVSLLALPGAVSGFSGCECEACKSTPDGCFESDKCIGEICNWNGPECDGCGGN